MTEALSTASKWVQIELDGAHPVQMGIGWVTSIHKLIFSIDIIRLTRKNKRQRVLNKTCLVRELAGSLFATLPQGIKVMQQSWF